MAITNHAILVAAFVDRESARSTVNELRRLGFTEGQIGMISREAGTVPVTGETATGTAEASKWEEGAATGIAAGAGFGALWALGIAAGVLPAIGPIIAGGLLASVLASAAGGAVVGGVVGALIGLGVPEEEARYYEGELAAGRTIVTVRAPGRYEEAEEVLHRYGGYDVRSREAIGSSAPPV
jgi:hypothetical protein